MIEATKLTLFTGNYHTSAPLVFKRQPGGFADPVLEGTLHRYALRHGVITLSITLNCLKRAFPKASFRQL